MAVNNFLSFSEGLFKRTADLMASEGYLKAGYNYVNIDVNK